MEVVLQVLEVVLEVLEVLELVLEVLEVLEQRRRTAASPTLVAF